MNILVLSDFFPPVLNAGAENIAYTISKEYVLRGHNVTVFTINENLESLSEILEKDGLKIIQCKDSYHNKYIAYKSLYNRKVLRILENILKESNFDFVHIHNIHKYISYGSISLIKKHNFKCILTAHDAMSVDYGKFTQGINIHDKSINPKINYKLNPLKTFFEYKKRYNPFRNLIIKYFLNKVDKIVPVSFELEKLLNSNGIQNTFVIHNGLEDNEQNNFNTLKILKTNFGIDDQDKILLWAGRLSKLKGSEQVIKLMKNLIQYNKNIKLLVVGNGTIDDNVLRNNIINTGWIDKDQMDYLYQLADLTLVYSIYPDPLPTVVLESMKNGTPVLGTCFGGTKEILINHTTGFIVNPFDIDYAYKKVIEIFEDKEFNSQVKINSKKEFNEKFIISECVDKYLALIGDLS